MNVKNFTKELIGREITVVNSTNNKLVGLQGKIIDETKATITIFGKKGKKVLLKNGLTFKLDKSGDIIVGEEVAKRSEDRLKGK